MAGGGPTEPSEQYGDVDGIVELLWAAAENDLAGILTALAKGIPASAADYDGRTALHLAAAEGQIEAVRYLLAHGHRLHVRDRWGSTPQDEAKREQNESVAELLAAAEGQRH